MDKPYKVPIQSLTIFYFLKKRKKEKRKLNFTKQKIASAKFNSISLLIKSLSLQMLIHPSLSLSSLPAIHKFSSPSPLFVKQCSSRSFCGPQRWATCGATGGREVDTFTEKSGYLFELSDSEADSVAEYSISKIASIYRRKPLVVIRRLFQIGTTFGKWFGLRFLDDLMERTDEMFQVPQFCFLMLYSLRS